MADNLIFTNKESEFLHELVKHGVEFMIVGLSAATLQGAPVVTQDIDLWFKNLEDPNLAKALKKVGASYIPPIALNPPMFAGKNVQMFDIVMTLSGLGSFSDEMNHTVDIPFDKFTVKALKLEQIILSKKAANRKKDQLTVPVLEDALLVIKSQSKE